MSTQANSREADLIADAARLRSTIGHAVTGAAVACYGKALRAVILTGSVARNEGSFLRESDGWRALGDAEFILVVHGGARAANACRMRLEADIREALIESGIRCDIGLTIAGAGFLKRMRPNIFVYELKTRGHVLWGDWQILDLIPPFEAAAIPVEDGWRLLQNRIVELLAAVDGAVSQEGPLPEEVYYRVVKLYVDMATSVLLFLGDYAPSYSERARRLQTAALPRQMAGLAAQVSACTAWKLHPATPAANNDAELWQEALRHAHQLWRWELARLTGLRDDANDHELFARWTAMQSYAQRARGWAYVVRSQGWLRSCREWGRWGRLAGTASPRYWIYSAANGQLFGRDAELAADGLPLRDASIWRNYVELVMETRS